MFNDALNFIKRYQHDKPLSREVFASKILERFLICALCAEKATVAHQIMDRRLFPNDDGYYVDNGVGLCVNHHKYAQATIITVEKLRFRAGIKTPLLPPQFRDDTVYDRWGNIIVNPELIILGPLKNEPTMHRALSAAKKQGALYEAMAFMIDEVKELSSNQPSKKVAIELENQIRRAEAERIKEERVSQVMGLDIVI